MLFNIFNTKKKYDFIGKYSALQIARYILHKCTVDGKPISNLQLQKILYYLQVYFLQDKNRVLFRDEIEAWTFGPVVRDVYNAYCGFGALDIYELERPDIAFSEGEQELIDPIIESKRILNPWQLVEDTHEKGKAWDLVYQDGLGYKEVIPKDVMISNG